MGGYLAGNGRTVSGHSNSKLSSHALRSFRHPLKHHLSSRGTVFLPHLCSFPPSHFHACALIIPIAESTLWPNKRIPGAQHHHHQKGNCKAKRRSFPAALLCYHQPLIVHGCALLPCIAFPLWPENGLQAQGMERQPSGKGAPPRISRSRTGIEPFFSFFL